MTSQLERDIVVIGASMGGVEALQGLMGQLQKDFAASLFIVQHMSPECPSVLDRVLSRAGSLEVTMPKDSEVIVAGRGYVAPPDRHLLVKPGHTHVVYGPKENRFRPAVDPLFRSAAVAYGPRVIGVVLTGYLDDGAAGLSAVKRCGGAAVVQDPLDAAAPDMPENALAAVAVDHTVPLKKLGSLLVHLTREPAGEAPPVPDDLRLEVAYAEGKMSNAFSGEELGPPTVFSCPECGGTLREVLTDPPLIRYRCHVGHAFTLESLIADQSSVIEGTLWAALRALEDRASLMTRMARSARQHDRHQSAIDYERQAAESHEHAEQLRKLLHCGG